MFKMAASTDFILKPTCLPMNAPKVQAQVSIIGVPKSTVTTTTNTSTPVYLRKSSFVDFDSLVRFSKRTRHLISQGLCPTLRLLGGGESSINNNSSAWNTSSSNNSANSGANPSWGNSTNSPSTNANNTNNSNRNGLSNSSLPMASSSENSNNKSNSSASTNQAQTSWVHHQNQQQQQQQQQQQIKSQNSNHTMDNANATNTNTTTNQQNSLKAQQYHELNVMRDALYSFDGWGTNINQDTPWEIPTSPEPTNGRHDANLGPSSAMPQQQQQQPQQQPSWKVAVNNGTEIWEANLRNGGQGPPPQTVQKAPWGHTPTKNIGGTWGEDDDATDSTNNMWNNVPNNAQAWGVGASASNAAVTGVNNAGAGTGAAAGAVAGVGIPNSSNTTDPRSMTGCGADITGRSSMATNLVDPRLVDPRSLINNRDHMVRKYVGMVPDSPASDLRGRLNNSSDSTSVWGQSHLHHPSNKMPPNANYNLNQWGMLSKDVPPKGGAAWEEPSSPPQRRNVPNYDDGTSLWGNPNGQPNTMGNVGGTVTQSRMKQDSSWGQTISRNGAAVGSVVWDENHLSSNWEDPNSAAPSGANTPSSWNKSKSSIPGQLWDNDIDWQNKHNLSNPNKQPPTKEMIYNSKQYRLLIELGYKREDIEVMLRRFDMNMEDALDALGPNRTNNVEPWRSVGTSGPTNLPAAMTGGTAGRHDDQFDNSNQFQNRFAQSFPTTGNNSSLLNNLSNSNMPNPNPNNISQSLLSSGNSNLNRNMQPMMSNATNNPNVRNIVTQIQTAIHNGYLNQHVLNQPFGPQQLVYLNQLLNLVKHLQQVTQQYNVIQNQVSATGAKNSANSNALLQYSLQIAKIKQQISNLQTHISNQASHNMYSKSMNPVDFYKSNDSLSHMQSGFADLSLSNKEPSISRLTQWKLPSLEKEFDMDFSRAPGASKAMPTANVTSNLNIGFPQNDGPWANTRVTDSGGWPENSCLDASHLNELKEAQWNQSVQPSFSDLVPEFEPGKPWKGTQMKSIEDDPSLTPGSALSSLVTIKDNDTYSSAISAPKSSSPTNSIVDNTLPSLNLNSSTWTYNSSTTTPSAFSSPLNKLASTKAAWNENELWSSTTTTTLTKSRGPPPGLAKNSIVNGWANNLSTTGRNTSWNPQSNLNNWQTPALSSWVLLRNLSNNVDGSTLRTLCMQHGPLQSFYLYLHQGIAFVKYSTREEASKAQNALNNCVLANTTIVAEFTTDADVNALLPQYISNQNNQSNNWRNSSSTNTNKAPAPTGVTSGSAGSGGAGSTLSASASGLDAWGGPSGPGNSNSAWSANNSNPSNSTSGGNVSVGAANLWNTNALDNNEPARTTPSSINNFLPGDLLGGESM